MNTQHGAITTGRQSGVSTVIIITFVMACATCWAGEFFAIAATDDTGIVSLDAAGTMTWTNSSTGGTNTIRRSRDLLRWVNYVQSPVTGVQQSVRVLYPKLGEDMAYVPEGPFQMGDTFSEGIISESPVHTVFISAYLIEKHEVSQSLWDQVYEWASTNGYQFDNAGSAKGSNHPVHSVNWYDCVKWCNARSEKEGFAPVYFSSDAKSSLYKAGRVDIGNSCVVWTNSGYRLPTEAEWEKAARGGAVGMRFPWSYTNTITHNFANYRSRTQESYDVSATRGYHPNFTNGVEPYTSPVGSFPPNDYDLFDMAGNIGEICWDWAAEVYGTPAGSEPDTRGPDSSPFGQRTWRGGMWDYYARSARCSLRGGFGPDGAWDGGGFRCVRRVP